MSLPATERRMLNGMEIALRAGDPGLSSMFAIFTRLNAGEPVLAEQLAPRGRFRWPRPATGMYAVVLIPLIFALITVGALFSGGVRGARMCEAGYSGTSGSPLVSRPVCQISGTMTAVKTTSGTTAAQTSVARTASGAGQPACAAAARAVTSTTSTGFQQDLSRSSGLSVTPADPSGACLQ